MLTSGFVWEADDFGSSHVISDQCRSHDCRDALLKFKAVNPAFKATLFAVPGEMTPELLKWCDDNRDWIELAVHGIFHSSNYECEKMTYEEFDMWMQHSSLRRILSHFVKGFRAPGWMISDDIYKWLLDHDWFVCDQEYNDERRPQELRAYVNNNNNFRVWKPGVGYGGYIPASHHHVWDVGWNGVYEQEEYILDLLKSIGDFKFVSQVIHEEA